MLIVCIQITECEELPNTLTEINNKLQVLKTIRHTLEQGQNRLRYALELKEKVVLNTEQAGAAKILEDIESLKSEFDRLITEVQVIVIIVFLETNT